MTDRERDERDEEGQEERPRIKVTDRRLFDREGNPRPDVEEERAEQPPRQPETVGETADATASSRPTATPGPRRAEGTQPGPPTAPDAGRGSPTADPGSDRLAAGEAPGGGPDDLPRDFVGFIEGQYYETLLYLGAMRHPATGQVMEDLDMAQYKIDLLSMLQEKTEGNRTPEESKILEDVLYQLRMGYLQKRKVAKL